MARLPGLVGRAFLDLDIERLEAFDHGVNVVNTQRDLWALGGDLVLCHLLDSDRKAAVAADGDIDSAILEEL